LVGRIPEDEERHWKEYGACWGSFDPQFFPETYGGKGAVEICKTCDVEEICLDYAIVSNQHHGVWGGKTRSQRLKIRYRDAKTEETQGAIQSAFEEESALRQEQAKT
jgi:WhiB family redox-sensing transcriptional regulator